MATPQGFLRLVVPLILALTLSGCRHKLVWSPPIMTDIALEPVEEPENPPTISTLPEPEMGPLPESIPTQPRPVRRRPAPAKDAGTPTPAGDPAELAIGELSTGGEGNVQTQQQARDMIGSIKSRISGLPRSTVNQQREPLRQVNNFLRQAQQALDSGDSDGAITLATKAGLIMDNIQKR